MTVITMKSAVIEFQMAPLIKSLAENISCLEGEGERKRENYEGRKGKEPGVGEKGESGAEKGRQEKEEREGGKKRLLCVVSETHFLGRSRKSEVFVPSPALFPSLSISALFSPSLLLRSSL